MSGRTVKYAVAAVLALLLAGGGFQLEAADKVKDDSGYGVRLGSSSIELVFPDGSVLSAPLDFDGKSIDKITATGGLAQELLDEAYSQLGMNKSAYLPKAFSLAQNYPNPFNPSTTIGYAIPEENRLMGVKLNVFNLRGQLIRTLVDQEQGPGTYNVNWDGTDERGRQIGSGVYFYRLVAGDFVSTRKMVVLK
ncbi:MAG: T9SS type A sorting domain-containing protein [Candidatus Glassbacteria bacterium]|nr:T9SS type A sorting domain-containing protein [Candidatus Glassbacteria bacterium]